MPERDREGLHHALMTLTESEVTWRTMGEAAAADVRKNFESAQQIANLEAAYDEARELGAFARRAR